MTPIDFYFDFISPFGYFASLRIDALAASHRRAVDWHSMLIGVSVLKVMGMKSLLATPLKGDYIRRDAARYARRHGIALGRAIDEPPSNPLVAGRAFHWLKRHHAAAAEPFAKALYDAYWVLRMDIGDADLVAAIGGDAGVLVGELRKAIDSPEAAALLREAVNASLKRGVFGSPFFIVDEEPFFGVEKMELLDEWLVSGGW